jgi:DNA-binding MarR family transcriptional regulator
MSAMSSQIIYLKDLPKHQTLRAMAKDYPQADIEAVELYILLLRLVNDMIAVVEAHLARHGLSRGRIAILMILRHQKHDSMCAAELARYCGVSRPTMTELIRGLIRSGLIRREPAAGDRRSSVILLTDKGRATMKAVMPDYYRKIQEFSQGLPAAMRNELLVAGKAMMANSELWRQSAAAQWHVGVNGGVKNGRGRMKAETTAGVRL